MLIDFSLKNYKSYRDEMTLSMVTSKKDLGFDSGFSKVGNLLNTVAILGPNASGKTKLLEGLKEMRDFVINSHQLKLSDVINVEPYALSENSLSKPTEFEVSVIIEDNIYQYGYICNTTEVFEEWLFVTPKDGRLQRWFQRGNKDNKDEWYINPIIKGARQTWINETRDNILLLSKITQANNELVKPLVLWFENNLRVYNALNSDYTVDKILENGNEKLEVIKMLKNADLGIQDIEALERDIDLAEITKGLPEELKNIVIKNLEGKKNKEVYSIHIDEAGNKKIFDFSEESEGTIKFFAFTGLLIDVLKKGDVLFFDELNRSLHFKEVEHIIKMFSNEETNPNKAQLIFTSHDTSIMNVLDKEEIYFTDKKNGFYTELYPLSDFENRDDGISIERRYRKGLYGALPRIGAYDNE